MDFKKLTSSDNIDNLKDRLRSLLTDQRYTDCSFKIANKIIKCHKLILATASPVFEAMFYGPLAEQNCIEIPDINPDIFEMMLNYIYTDEIKPADRTLDNLMELYYCGEKYLIDDLLKKCNRLLLTIIDLNNIFQAIDLATFLNLKSLLLVCMNYFTNVYLTNSDFAKMIYRNKYQLGQTSLQYLIKYNSEKYPLHMAYFLKQWMNGRQKTRIDEVGKNLTYIFDELNVSPEILQHIVSKNFVLDYKNSSWIIFHRTYYKPLRPLLIIEPDTKFLTSITINYEIQLKSLLINSRLSPTSQNDSALNYTENIRVVIFNDSDDRVFSENFIVFNTEYNSSLRLIFNNSIKLEPNIIYKIEFSWNSNSNGFEYPQSMFSWREKHSTCQFDFDTHLDYCLMYERSSILIGIEYMLPK